MRHTPSAYCDDPTNEHFGKLRHPLRSEEASGASRWRRVRTGRSCDIRVRAGDINCALQFRGSAPGNHDVACTAVDCERGQSDLDSRESDIVEDNRVVAVEAKIEWNGCYLEVRLNAVDFAEILSEGSRGAAAIAAFIECGGKRLPVRFEAYIEVNGEDGVAIRANGQLHLAWR